MEAQLIERNLVCIMYVSLIIDKNKRKYLKNQNFASCQKETK